MPSAEAPRATAAADGRPWASPVWFAPDDGGFLWISRPESRHSLNIAERAQMALVIVIAAYVAEVIRGGLQAVP